MSLVPVFLILALSVHLDMALKCKKGQCKNNKDETGCKPMLEGLEDMDCKEDSVCYREHQLTYNDEEVISVGCVSKTDGKRDPIASWTFFDDTLTADEIKNSINKECVEKEKDKASISINIGGAGGELEAEKQKVKLCVCDDKDLCNFAASTRFCGMTLILMGILSILL